MHAEKSNFTIARMARLLGVSRSGYYAWLSRVPSDRALRRERIEAKIVWFHGASDEVFGSPRILADLRADNAMAESFFATLKTEFYYRRIWPTKARARLEVGAWIQDRYNRRRRHSSIGQLTPVAFEMQHCNHPAADQQAA